MSINNVLHEIQTKLKAPKGQYNSFGKYKYRNCEDILEAVKPLLPEGTCVSLTDEPVLVGDRFYIHAKAVISNDKGSVEVSGYAREPLSKKGMDESQITGAASSYARKYALNGLFCIDDTKDADSQDNTNSAPVQKTIQSITENEMRLIIGAINGSVSKSDLDDAKLKATQAKARMSPEQVSLIKEAIKKSSNEVTA